MLCMPTSENLLPLLSYKRGLVQHLSLSYDGANNSVIALLPMHNLQLIPIGAAVVLGPAVVVVEIAGEFVVLKQCWRLARAA